MKHNAKANRVESYGDLKHLGDFIWCDMGEDGRPARLLFICPCGCGAKPGVTIAPAEPKPEDKIGWNWNGDLEAPTLTPSIKLLSGCQWHGFLDVGEFREC